MRHRPGRYADRARILVGTFCVTQTVGYGVLFYAFGVFITPMAAELHTSRAAVTGALTLSILITAVAALPVGRWIDRQGGRGLMTLGSALGTGAVVAWSQVREVWQLYAVFVLIGLASAAVLYEAAFAVVVKQVPAARRPGSILAITIVAGFASTVFLPVAGLLDVAAGWRTALLILAAIHGALTITPHFLWVPIKAKTNSDHPGPQVSVRAALGDKVFWLAAVAFTANGAALFAVAVHIVGYLLSLGHRPALAATLAGLLGVMSVTGRVVTTALARRYSISSIVAGVSAVQAGVILVLPLAGREVAGASACILLFGLGFGVANIAKPAILAGRYGARDFGAISGAVAIPVTIAKAAGPLIVAAVSLAALPLFAAAGCLVAAGCLALMHGAGKARETVDPGRLAVLGPRT